MTIDLRTASVDEMRDWLAKELGWTVATSGWFNRGGFMTWPTVVTVDDTGDELADRMRLTCMALAAERGIK